MINYKHLHYFWVVAKEGSITRAAERLGVAIQTISGQLGLLERQLGKTLFNSQGRGLVLSEAGRKALSYADQIFQLGEQLEEAMQNTSEENTLRLRVGISDGIPKLLAYRLLSRVTAMPGDVRLICDEGEFENLLAELALHRLDVVLTDRAAPQGGNLKVFSTRLGEFPTGIYASAPLAGRYQENFPACLEQAPMLLPTRHNALRGRIDRWLEEHQLHPEDRRRIRGQRLADHLRPRRTGPVPGTADPGRSAVRRIRCTRHRRDGRRERAHLRHLQRTPHPPPGNRGAL